jgi:hypothetical protein
MPVGLLPKTAPLTKSESVVISTSYPNVSIFCWRLQSGHQFVGGRMPRAPSHRKGSYGLLNHGIRVKVIVDPAQASDMGLEET